MKNVLHSLTISMKVYSTFYID